MIMITDVTIIPEQITLLQWIFSNTHHQSSDVITKKTEKLLHFPSQNIKAK